MGYAGAAVYSDSVTLAECLTAWFEKTVKKQKFVAEQSGLAPSKISALASGDNVNPSWNTIKKVAKGFGVTPDVFLAGPEQTSGHAKEGAHERDHVQLLTTIDAEAPAEDSWRGDVLKAVAVLNRALRRSEVAPSQASPFRNGERRKGERRRTASHASEPERRTRADRRTR